MIKKGLLTVSVLSLTMSMFLAACGAGSNETTIENGAGSAKANNKEQKVKLTFWDNNAGPDRTPHYQELIRRFQEKNANIEVEYVGIPTKTAKEKIDVAIATQEMPDVTGLSLMWIGDFVANDALLPLDPFYDKWEDKDKIAKAEIDSQRAAAKDAKLYRLPTADNMDILWYRSDWFKEAGVNPPQTWDDFFNAAQKMTDPSKNRFGFTIRGGDGGGFQLQRLMFAYSGISKYFDESGKSTINDPKHVEFVKKYLSMYKKNTAQSDVTNGYKEMVASFDTGVAAMMQHNLGSYGEHSKTLQEGQFAAMPLPKSNFNGKIVIEGGNSSGFAIFKSTKHPEEAWKFLSYLGSADGQSYFNQKTGQMPTNNEVLQNDWVKKANHIQITGAAFSDKDAVFNNPPFYLPEYQQILSQVVEPGMQAVMMGRKTAEEFLNEWAKALENSQVAYNKNAKK
jgi:multiple sugar transport system substrate-binding protein